MAWHVVLVSEQRSRSAVKVSKDTAYMGTKSEGVRESPSVCPFGTLTTVGMTVITGRGTLSITSLKNDGGIVMQEEKEFGHERLGM